MFSRLWVRIPVPCTGWTFFTLFGSKIALIFVWTDEKEAEDSPFQVCFYLTRLQCRSRRGIRRWPTSSSTRSRCRSSGPYVRWHLQNWYQEIINHSWVVYFVPYLRYRTQYRVNLAFWSKPKFHLKRQKFLNNYCFASDFIYFIIRNQASFCSFSSFLRFYRQNLQTLAGFEPKTSTLTIIMVMVYLKTVSKQFF